MSDNREKVLNLRTIGKKPPVESDVLQVEQGEIALAMDKDFPRIYFKQNDGEWATFVDIKVLENQAVAISKAINDLNDRLSYLEKLSKNTIANMHHLRDNELLTFYEVENVRQYPENTQNYIPG